MKQPYPAWDILLVGRKDGLQQQQQQRRRQQQGGVVCQGQPTHSRGDQLAAPSEQRRGGGGAAMRRAAPRGVVLCEYFHRGGGPRGSHFGGAPLVSLRRVQATARAAGLDLEGEAMRDGGAATR
eukprot:scaffold4409_cov369-Prasinococcus_capsulatus_cf.AAC.5